MLPLTTAVAAAVTLGGCGQSGIARQDIAVCRDARGYRTDDSACTRRASGAHGGGWHYYSRGDRVPQQGERVTGGYDAPRAGVSYGRASSATVSRGGFGSSARGFGGAGE